jgi:ubiquinone biosynthesis O-methyltransferase
MAIRRFSSVNADEVARFSGWKWWNTQDPLHAFTDVRVQFIREQLGVELGKPLLGKKVLDVGCGGGILSERLGRLGARVVGVDPAAQAIETARRHMSADLEYYVEYRNVEVESVQEQYDVVIASEVIEHVSDQKDFLAQVVSKVKVKTTQPGGDLILTCPNRTVDSYFSTILSNVYAVAEYVLKKIEIGTHSWDKYITQAEIDALLLSHNYRVIRRQGWLYNPLCHTAFMTDYERFGYMLHAKAK